VTACGTVLRPSASRIDAYLRVRRGGDQLYFDLIRQSSDEGAVRASLLELSRTILLRL
jgi:hypothetical protein